MENKNINKLIPKELCLYYNSAWIGHGPFAMWLVKALKPKNIVELGSHGGYSYFAFCQAVQENALDTKCYAIDTWEGDEHASFYDNSIYENVKAINDKNYVSFSTLVRKRFDQAIEQFEDKSIDLLHIDGRHGYEDVKYDFECYKDKLSDNAVVLFHDVNCYKPGFGVHKYFSELKQQYPTTEFTHSSGLGVLFFGKNQNKNLVKYLCNKKSLLFNSLYFAGLSSRNHFKLARLNILVKEHQNNKQSQIEAYKYAKKVFIKDLKFNLRLFFISLKSKFNKLFATQ